MRSKKLKLPRSVSILGQKFKVELVADLVLEDSCYGETVVIERIIRVCATKNKTQEQADATLLHEIVHANLGVSGISEVLGEKVEEGLVVALENGLN